GDGEDAVGLDDDRDRDQGDQQRVGNDRLRLECEQQDHRRQQADDRPRLQPSGKSIDRSFIAFVRSDDLPPGQRTGRQRDYNVQDDREKQRLPRYDNVGDAQQQRDDRREG